MSLFRHQVSLAYERRWKEFSTPSAVAGLHALAPMAGFSWILIVVTVIVAVLALLTALYLLVYYQHPEDKNQVTYCSILPAGILL